MVDQRPAFFFELGRCRGERGRQVKGRVVPQVAHRKSANLQAAFGRLCATGPKTANVRGLFAAFRQKTGVENDEPITRAPGLDQPLVEGFHPEVFGEPFVIGAFVVKTQSAHLFEIDPAGQRQKNTDHVLKYMPTDLAF